LDLWRDGRFWIQVRGRPGRRTRHDRDRAAPAWVGPQQDAVSQWRTAGNSGGCYRHRRAGRGWPDFERGAGGMKRILIWLALPAALFAAPTTENAPVFEKDVLPIFSPYCFACHRKSSPELGV